LPAWSAAAPAHVGPIQPTTPMIAIRSPAASGMGVEICDAPAIIAAAVYAGHRYAPELGLGMEQQEVARHDKLFDSDWPSVEPVLKLSFTRLIEIGSQ
jgi:hypothetical protein